MDVLLILNGVVENCISADSAERAAQFFPWHTCVERTPELAAVGPGHSYDALTGEFTAPAPPPKEPAPPISQVAFLKRIPMLKRIAIRSAAATDAVIADAMSLLSSADVVHLDDPDLNYFAKYLVMRGYLTEAESSALLGS